MDFGTRDEPPLNNFRRPVLHSTDMFAVVDKGEIEASAGISRNVDLILMDHFCFRMYRVMAIIINLLNRDENQGETIRYMWRYLNVIRSDNCAVNDNILAFSHFNINTFKAKLLPPLPLCIVWDCFLNEDEDKVVQMVITSALKKLSLCDMMPAMDFLSM